MNWNQLRTVLWLRWRLTRNQWARSGGLGAVIAMVAVFSSLVLGAVCFVGALGGAVLGLANVPPAVIMAIWCGITVAFLFFWTIGLLAELQRSETIDLQRLMHLPVALGQMFAINYLVSHFTLSIAVAVPAMLGLAIGLGISRGPQMLLLIPLALGMVFMVTAWTYCLRGWLATLMSNPRRRRTVIMTITFVFILISQGPNLYFNVFQNRAGPSAGHGESRNAHQQEMFNELLAAQDFLPPLWVAVGARGLAEGNAWPAWWGLLGCLGLGLLGLRRAYRSTVRFYTGQTGGRAAVRTGVANRPSLLPATAERGSRRFLELELPAVPEQAAALALATFRSMLRAPEVKMAWATSFLMSLIAGASFLLRAPPTMSETAKPFIATAVVLFSVFMMVQFLVNQFGFDRDGFRSLMFSPVDRRLVLLGKNLACLPAGAGFGTLLLMFVSFWLHAGLLTFLAGLFQLAAVLLIGSLAGNLLSILVPYRIQAGSLKPTKMPGVAMLVLMFCQLFFPIALSPVFLPAAAGWAWQCAGWPDQVPVNLLLSMLLAAVAAVIYWQSLDPLGRLLYRRETKILAVVTVEVE